MFSKNGASKGSHHGSIKISDDSSSLASKQPKRSINSRLSSQNPRKQSSSSILAKESSVVRASPSDSGNATSIYKSTPDTHQNLNMESSSRLAYTQTDLLSMSAWIYSNESAPRQQDFSYPYHSHVSTQTSTCPCHMSIGSEYNTVCAGFGLAPLERWLSEDLGDGGVVALQLGHQLRMDCTCIAIQDGTVNAVNGAQPGFSSHN